MKAKELIKILEKNPEAIIVVTSNNFEMKHATIEATSANLINATCVTETFRDAFDGESYDSEVWRLYEGDAKVIKIS